jgi:hypothetical protein
VEPPATVEDPLLPEDAAAPESEAPASSASEHVPEMHSWDTPMPADVPDELRLRIEAIAPPRPMGLDRQDAEAVARWEMCARIAAMVALDQGEGDTDGELRKFAWGCARTLYESALPMGEPTA